MEELIPWERQVYVTMYQQAIEVENARIEARNAQIRGNK